MLIAVQLNLTTSDMPVMPKALKNAARIIMGILNKKEYRALLTLSKPHAKPAAIVEPDLDKPGATAKP